MSENQLNAASPVVAWSDDVDVAFFRITAAIFTPRFTDGASALLGSFDPEQPARGGRRAPLTPGHAR